MIKDKFFKHYVNLVIKPFIFIITIAGIIYLPFWLQYKLTDNMELLGVGILSTTLFGIYILSLIFTGGYDYLGEK